MVVLLALLSLALAQSPAPPRDRATALKDYVVILLPSGLKDGLSPRRPSFQEQLRKMGRTFTLSEGAPATLDLKLTEGL